VIGAGPNLATANEGALELQGAAHIAAHAWELEEAMTGPWVSIDPGDFVVLLALQGPSFSKAAGFAAALARIGAEVWMITDAPDNIAGPAHVTRLALAIPECLTPLYTVLPLYHFVYQVALARGPSAGRHAARRRAVSHGPDDAAAVGRRGPKGTSALGGLPELSNDTN
jgi:glucosamine 6-phosphate synthetase-like amidotransferase/phosphosugar isomerase protein